MKPAVCQQTSSVFHFISLYFLLAHVCYDVTISINETKVSIRRLADTEKINEETQTISHLTRTHNIWHNI